MCAILDANSAHDVFGLSRRSAAGKDFYAHLQKGGMELVVGGKVLQELRQSSGEFREWLKEADRDGHRGRIRNVAPEQVNARQAALERTANLRSNDPHVIALAQVSGARLLYTKDRSLRKDFSNKEFLNNPRGMIYPVGDGPQAKRDRKDLRHRNICGRHTRRENRINHT